MIEVRDITIEEIEFPLHEKEQVDFINQSPLHQSIINILPSHLLTKRKAEFLAGRLAALKAIKKIKGEEGYYETINRDKNGVPIWPKDIVGSISHSSNLACAAISLKENYQSIGIDIEHIIDDKKIENLQDIVLKPIELKLYNGQVPFNEFFTLCYSFKETLYKTLFPITQEFIDFGQVSINMVDFKSKKISAHYQNAILKTDSYTASFLTKPNSLLTLLSLPR